eukprot:TRINITY_DN723_c0_g1_i1.p1 TRINITY_DN723_c0_g1~~TRINITY_DN723_c0_g1_i1.p1  ORF type:complete len:174 (-),score=13.33 TRINITY_DN723_c0_g1_i1:135-656(-)
MSMDTLDELPAAMEDIMHAPRLQALLVGEDDSVFSLNERQFGVTNGFINGDLAPNIPQNEAVHPSRQGFFSSALFRRSRELNAPRVSGKWWALGNCIRKQWFYCELPLGSWMNACGDFLFKLWMVLYFTAAGASVRVRVVHQSRGIAVLITGKREGNLWKCGADSYQLVTVSL